MQGVRLSGKSYSDFREIGHTVRPGEAAESQAAADVMRPTFTQLDLTVCAERVLQLY